MIHNCINILEVSCMYWVEPSPMCLKLKEQKLPLSKYLLNVCDTVNKLEKNTICVFEYFSMISIQHTFYSLYV